MKINIRPFTKFLVKQNLSYIIATFVLVILTVFVAIFIYNGITVTRAQISMLRTDAATLALKKREFEFLLTQPDINLDDDVKLMNQLIPDIDSYFTLAAALEELSTQTGLIIDSYNVPVKAPEGKLSITISGSGDRESFIAFLNNHNFVSGRLATIDKVTLDSTGNTFSIGLNFYNKDVRTLQEGTDRVKSIEKLNKLKNKFNLVFKTPVEEVIEEGGEYPVKSNPF